MFSIFYPITALSQAELTRNDLEIWVNIKIFSSHVLKISEISFVLRTREFTDIFITVDEICLVFTSNKVNIHYNFITCS